MKKFFRKIYLRNKEKGNDLVNVLGLIIISVVILALFRSKLGGTFSSAMDKADQEVNDLFEHIDE